MIACFFETLKSNAMRTNTRIFILVGLFQLLGTIMIAQTKKENPSSDLEGLTGKLTLGAQQFPTVPMESTIDPEQYFVGPSDIINVGLWGPLSASLPLTSAPLVVTPEGTLIVPTVGEIKVAGLSLADVKERVSREVKKKYLDDDVTVTLLSPRSFLVKVSGAGLNQDTYVASAVERVDKLVTEAIRMHTISSTAASQTMPTSKEQGIEQGKESLVKETPVSEAKRNELKEPAKELSTRNILLRRRDGKSCRVDILLYYATGDGRYNPFLLDGDAIVIPRKDLERNFVSIYGAVNAPGQYEFVDDDSLTRIVKIAQGTTEIANLEDVIVSRLSGDGSRTDEIHLNLDAILQGTQADFPLHRGDRISVKEKTDLRGDYKVLVVGEVRQPGYIFITRQSTRLSKVIEEAGGFTEYASLPEAMILRSDQDFPEMTRGFSYARILRSIDPSPFDSLYYLASMRSNYRTVVVDFPRLFTRHDSVQDVTILDKDVIIIPSNRNTVYVDGQVVNPGHVPFVPGQNFEDYIKNAGGYSEEADDGETRVIKGKTLEWMKPGDTTIESGDRIYVPRKPRREFIYYFNIFRDIFGIATGVVTIALLYIQLHK
jgi:protein involved in polysaccharide export with SLBB domain